MGKNIDFASKKVVIADLDGTLAESKSPIDIEMAQIISKIIENRAFAIISGGSYIQFEKQVIGILQQVSHDLSNLYLFPTNSTELYVFMEGTWHKKYSEALSKEEKSRIIDALEKTIGSFEFARPEKVFGEQIEDRNTQITFSALGQQAPLEFKKEWDPDNKRRNEMKKMLDSLLPAFEVRLGGTTSIDITRKGVDKAYGIRKIVDYLHCSIGEAFFIGDALFEGGNDYPAISTGIDCVQITSTEETKAVLRQIAAIAPKNL